MIIAISDRKLFYDYSAYKQQLVNLIDSPIDYLIIREKDLSDGDLQNLLFDIMTESQILARQKIVVHTREHIAKNLGLTHIHHTEKNIEQMQVKQLSYSYSLHAKTPLYTLPKNANFFLISPVFKTACKPGSRLLQQEEVERLLKKCQAPVVALGGINTTHMPKLKDLGFKHVAMRSEMMNEQKFMTTISDFKRWGF